MTNRERWLLYTKSLCSPELFIEFGYYYLIGAALQRRVWFGPDYARLYPNPYIILCAGPGIGKGLVINQVVKFLSFHKQHGHSREAKEAQEFTQGNFMKNGAKHKAEQIPLAIPMSSDTATWQGLMDEMAESLTGVSYINHKGEQKTETYSALACCLEELSSMFQADTQNVVNFFLKVYDCNDYKQKTRGRKLDIVQRPCLSMLAGTTPSFMQQTFDDKLLNEGFSSRAWYVCAKENRFNELFLPTMSVEQRIAETELKLHLYYLTKVYGGVDYTPEAREYLSDWYRKFKDPLNITINRINHSPKLDSYYARINIHIHKLAIAIHFSEPENIDKKFMSIDTAKSSIALLQKMEKSSHLALTFKALNPRAAAGQVLIKYLKNKKIASRDEIVIELWEHQKRDETLDLINDFMMMGKLDLQIKNSLQQYSLKAGAED